uniref:Tyrosyl-DNA phosphodiesterase 2 n=1 Tax=Neogobius melanostomus TaxID=47308 RepID=A0A8C6S2G3_9GOBI
SLQGRPGKQLNPSSAKPSREDDSKLSLVSWNVDGLDIENLIERAWGLCSYLDIYTPDVVFLQELIPPYVQYLKKNAVSYLIIEGGKEGYFTGMMLKRSRVELLEKNIVPYPTTTMLRNLLVAQVDHKLCLMTSHMESCKGHAEERMKQLRVVMQRMTDAPDDVTVLFGGDTNLRDTEVIHTLIWAVPGESGQTRARSAWPLPDHMALIGREKLDCGRFTSDHWGIYCCFVST